MIENVQSEAPDPQTLLRRFRLDLHDVERHVVIPDPVRDGKVFIDRDDRYLPREPLERPFFSFLYGLNTDRLAARLHDILTPCVMGYALQLRHSGSVVFSQTWRWSKTRKDGETGWDVDTPMHLASTSKLITAMALTRLLDSKRIDYDSPVNPWLPTYWPRGNNIDKLTFSHLLTHKSGLFSRGFTGVSGPCDYPDMKAAIAEGTTSFATSDYKNIN